MKRIDEHMSQPSRRSTRDKATERGELLQYFVERINPGRKYDGYPPLTIARMARTLVGIPTKDLYYLKRICEEAKDFSKKFWWEVDPKKHEKEEENKKATIFKGQAEAESNRLKVSAGLSPQEAAEWKYKTAVDVAKALSTANVPSILINGGDGKSGSNPMDAIGINMLLDIQNRLDNKK
jgi:hypothetical protein